MTDLQSRLDRAERVIKYYAEPGAVALLKGEFLEYAPPDCNGEQGHAPFGERARAYLADQARLRGG